MSNKLCIEADKVHAQKAIRWLRRHHNIMANYQEGHICAEATGDEEALRTLLKDSLQATKK